jgi:serine/threonine protein phosphatase 1
MIYVSSDLHGVSPQDFKTLLSTAGFTDQDTLYILGDVIDRGDHGIDLLLMFSEMPNAQLILGNHESMLLGCDFLLDDVTEDSLNRLTGEKLSLLSNWLANGAAPTLAGLKALRSRDPELVWGIMDYLKDAPLYEIVSAGGKNFVLTHSGLGNFCADKRLSQYTADELLWTRPALTDRYFNRAMVVFGHTPTASFGTPKSRALSTDTWICIDTGSGHGGQPMLLRLDDLSEFYLD